MGALIRHQVKFKPLAYPEEARSILRINEEAAMFYYGNLQKDNAGSHYFRKRRISKADVDEFGLGYAPDSFTAFYDHVKGKYPEEELEASGLFRRDKNGNFYDFFRNRVMFPIFGYDGEVIAFGGRVMDDSKPKYLNSSESAVFSKHENLYGFPFDEEPQSDTILICEGYMDLIAAKKAGIRDSAAVLGTALTAEHARLIASRYQKVCLGLDSDAAGIRAINRSIRALEAENLTVTVPQFQPAKDPDEFFVRFGAKALRDRIASADDARRIIAKYTDAEGLLDILADQELNKKKEETK